MTNLVTIPMQDDFETTLSSSWGGSTGTVSVNDTPSGTMPVGGYSYIVVNPGEANMQVAKIDGWDGTGKTFNVSSISVKKGTGVYYTSQSHAANSVVRFSNNYQFWADLQTAINSKLDSTGLGDFTISGSSLDTPAPMTFSDNETAPVTLKTLASGNGADQYFAISENDTTVGHFEDKVVSGTGITQTKNNPGANETMTISVDTNTIATKDYVDDEIDGIPSYSLTNSDYIAGEDITQGDSLFVEDMVTFASATNAQNIGDITANTRVAIRAIGSGVAGTTINLALAKASSPSVNLNLRIETDNAGSPSGTLINANATATIAPGSLTTSLADTALTLAGSINIPKGTKVWLVLYVGTYGSETVNGTNYYKIGYGSNNTTTRINKYWNGTTRALGTGVLVNENAQYNSYSGSPTTTYQGYKILATQNCYLLTVTKDGNCTATTAYLKDNGGTQIATATFSGNIATFTTPQYLSSGTNYRIELGSGGSTYQSYYDNTATRTTGTNINIVTGSQGGSDIGNQYNITYIGTIGVNSSGFYYASSTLLESILLSKTDADYTYKLPDIPRIATANYSTGDLVKYDFQGITKVLSGLTKDSTYYISNTPGALSTSAGTNSYKIGLAKNTDELLLGGGIGGEFSLNNNTVYYASQDGFVSGYYGNTYNGTVNMTLIGYKDSVNGSTAVIKHNNPYAPSGQENAIAMTFPVKKGEYFKVYGSANSSTSSTFSFKFYPN